VEKAISLAPHEVSLFDRHCEPTISAKGSRSYFSPGSDCLHIIDHRTGERRSPIYKDVIEGTILCDALENIDFLMLLFLPVDVDREMADRYEMEAMLNNTTKTIVFVTYELSGCIDAVKMAEGVPGGARELAGKPFVAC
jgi:trimethylamine--corrinoid protein Co-methyltransferase